eukprot:3118971-Rhodomonas_salina.2
MSWDKSKPRTQWFEGKGYLVKDLAQDILSNGSVTDTPVKIYLPQSGPSHKKKKTPQDPEGSAASADKAAAAGATSVGLGAGRAGGGGLVVTASAAAIPIVDGEVRAP